MACLSYPGVLLGHDKESQAQAIENGQRLVEAYASLTVFQSRHQVDRDAEQCCSVVDT